MATNIDDLQIRITANNQGASKSINNLIKKLGNLQSSLTSVSGSGLKNYSNNANKATNQTKNFSSQLNKMNNSANRTTKSTKSLAYAFGKFYANYFLFIRAFKGLFNSIESTADYIEAFNYFNVALGKIGSEWSHQFEKYGYENAEVYAESFNQRLTQALSGLSGVQISIGADGSGLLTESGMKNLGLNIKEITQYASQLASVTNSVGQTGEVSLAAAEAFTKLGADISSLFNLDYSAVMTNLQSGLIGQSRALYKYGIDITNATLQTYAYELGLEKAVSEMTQAEKMQLRMIAILDQSKVSWGDLANTLNSPSNLIRQFTNNLKEAGMVLGQLFMPLLQKVLPVINGVTIAIKRLLVSIAGFLGISLDLSSFGQGYSDMADGAGDLSDSLGDAAASAKKLKTATLGIDELNINAPQDDASGSGAFGGGIDLTKEIMDAAAEYEKVWDEAFAKMESRAQAFADAFEKFLQPISDMFKNLFSGNFEMAGGNLSDFFMQLMDIDWDSIYAKSSGFGKGLAEFLNGLISPKLFNKAGNTIASSLNTALNFLNSFGKTFDWTDFGISLADGVKGFFENWDAGLTAETLSTFANGILVAAKSAIDELGENDTFEDIGQKLVDFICGIDWGSLTWNLANFFASMADALAEFPTDFCKGIAEGILKNIFGHEVKIELPKWLEDGIKYMFVGITPHIALLSFLPSQEEFNDWFTNDVSPWFSEERWALLWDNIKNAFATKWEELKTWWRESAIYLWFMEDVTPWFSIEKWSELWENVKESFSTKWSEIKSWWASTAIAKWWKEDVQPWFTKKKWEDAMIGVKEAFKNTWNNAISSIKQIWNAFATWLNEKLTWTIEPVVVLGKTIFPGTTINLGRIPTFQTGGFPEDGLFMANHNELVGQFSNGRTAVANNEQIVAGIKEGVREAVAEILAPYLADIAQNTRETADKDLTVAIGDRDIARANARGKRSLGYQLVT